MLLQALLIYSNATACVDHIFQATDLAANALLACFGLICRKLARCMESPVLLVTEGSSRGLGFAFLHSWSLCSLRLGWKGRNAGSGKLPVHACLHGSLNAVALCCCRSWRWLCQVIPAFRQLTCFKLHQLIGH